MNHNNFVNNDSDPTNTKNQMELSKIIEVKEQNKNNINKSNDQINYKKLKIAFVILGAVSIISITFLFINIFYFELAVFHFLNILLIALFVLSVVPIVALSIAIKNINILPENFCLRNLLEYLISPRLEKTKSMDQNLKIDLQMQNQQIKS